MSEQERDKTLQANGLTVGEMKKLQRKQQLGEEETEPANRAEVIGDKYFDDEYNGYMIRSAEDHLVHLALEARSFNPGTGEKLSNSFVQMFDVKTFEKMKKDDAFKGYVSHIIHYPTELQQQPKNARKEYLKTYPDSDKPAGSVTAVKDQNENNSSGKNIETDEILRNGGTI